MTVDKSIPIQFIENMKIMSKANFETLKKSKVLLIGLGGLGGHVANNLVRLGVHHLGLVDFDRFEGRNLNRQLFSNAENIGKYKTVIVSHELQKINTDCVLEEYTKHIQELPQEQIEKFDFIIDAVDNPETKKYIAKIAKSHNKPLLHGACAGWYGQIGWILPDNDLIEEIYEENKKGIEQDLSNPSFTPAVVAGIMVSEFLKYIIDPKSACVNKLLLLDIYNNNIINTGNK